MIILFSSFVAFGSEIPDYTQKKLESYKSVCSKYLRTSSDSTLIYANRILSISIEINSKAWESMAYQYMGSYHIRKGHMAVGFDYLMKALSISESLEDWSDVANISNNLGVFYIREHEHERSIYYYNKALIAMETLISESDNITKRQRSNLIAMIFNLGEVYSIIHENDSAEKYLNEAFFESIKHGYKEQEEYVIAIRSRVFFNQNKVELAIKEIIEPIQYFKLKNNLDGYNEYSLWLSEYYLHEKQYGNAKKVALDIYGGKTIDNTKFWKKEASNMLHKIEAEKGNWKIAYKYNKEYHQLGSELDNADIRERIERIKQNYLSEKRLDEISSLKEKNTLSNQLVHQQTRFIYLMVALFVIMIVGIYFLLKFYLGLKKAYANIREKNNEIEAQQEEILAQKDHLQNYVQLLDNKNKQVEAGITYAKRIQSATLPVKSKMESILGDVTLFYQPCGLVSGDFYYCSGKLYKNNERICIVATVDCTGHGVPGAFMSLIGNGILNEIIKVKHIVKPSDILEGLHQRLQTTLSQYEEYGVQDGMDITVACINYSQQNVTVCSAKNSWVYFKDDQLNYVKGDRRNIGGMDLNTSNFRDHEISFANSKISFYFYSDGYQDQLGGEKNKKYMIKNFRNLYKRQNEKYILFQSNCTVYFAVYTILIFYYLFQLQNRSNHHFHHGNMYSNCNFETNLKAMFQLTETMLKLYFACYTT
ncbi:SpoIIE family protein phosphatase [Flammeovirga sp. MY04]|uniref:SpoIIE family protein phosphatase n=1 Tax=Flammeovirga sp. MY04 TaxID=1191459 RepID=UPI000A06DDCB|nr:SpoIIE family protein phosphatase [Flammeovirga sp. MY04]ANQ52146.2 SpoIIE family protein phosphatase [Flammeovirga sp. MY04]